MKTNKILKSIFTFVFLFSIQFAFAQDENVPWFYKAMNNPASSFKQIIDSAEFYYNTQPPDSNEESGYYAEFKRWKNF